MDKKIAQKISAHTRVNPYVNYLGIQLVKIEEGMVEAVMPLTDEQKQ